MSNLNDILHGRVKPTPTPFDMLLARWNDGEITGNEFIIKADKLGHDEAEAAIGYVFTQRTNHWRNGV